ncbi:MAG TPA: MBL fold metallo-hydrolase [Patescibacteria group bacterium]|nr:MBL fold metallo-hydrolase [Patescibacteria group bacterium]
MILERVSHPRWLSNTWLMAGSDGGTGILVDAGGPAESVLDLVRRRRVRVTHILNTHHHHDHTCENAVLRRATGARLLAHRLEAPLIEGLDAALEDGERIDAGDLDIRVLHIPGHTAGQSAFLVSSTHDAGGPPVCFTGDTLFRGSVGSTTAPGHTHFADLRRSLVDRLLALPDATLVAPGHADTTTIGDERARNPFLRVLLGVDPEGRETARYDGREVRLVVWARDYDGGHKAWVRSPETGDDTVPGSRVERPGRAS